MASIRARRGGVEVSLDEAERQVLLTIIERLEPDLEEGPRARPRAYDDDEMHAEYERLVRPDLDEARRRDVEAVRETVVAGRGRLRLGEPEALTWLRAFNHLRLAAGATLGIEEDGWELDAPAEMLQREEYAMLMTLGWIQESIIEALAR